MTVPLFAWPLIAVAAALGALLRVAVERLVDGRTGWSFPAGTLAVNLTGSFVLGVLAGSGLGGTLPLVAGTGLVGSYTTFSTLVYETERLAEADERVPAMANLFGSLVLGLAAVAAGWAIGGL